MELCTKDNMIVSSTNLVQKQVTYSLGECLKSGVLMSRSSIAEYFAYNKIMVLKCVAGGVF